jgi:hypothetical protein
LLLCKFPVRFFVCINTTRFGPNTFPAHNSVIFASEVQVDYIAKTLFQPIINGRAATVEVKKEAEEGFVESIDVELNGTVFSAGCSNWYMNKKGRNSASWPGYAATYWYRTFFPRWNDFVLENGSKSKLGRLLQSVYGVLMPKITIFLLLVTTGLIAKETTFGRQLQNYVMKALL